MDIEIDFENVITVKLYNLFLAIDVLYGTDYVRSKKHRFFCGMYDCLLLPIKEKSETDE